MSGFPLLDLLLEHETSSTHPPSESPDTMSPSIAPITDDEPTSPKMDNWFPDRQEIKNAVRPQDIWSMISSVIAPDLMDRSVIGIVLLFTEADEII